MLLAGSREVPPQVSVYASYPSYSSDAYSDTDASADIVDCFCLLGAAEAATLAVAIRNVKDLIMHTKIRQHASLPYIFECSEQTPPGYLQINFCDKQSAHDEAGCVLQVAANRQTVEISISYASDTSMSKLQVDKLAASLKKMLRQIQHTAHPDAAHMHDLVPKDFMEVDVGDATTIHSTLPLHTQYEPIQWPPSSPHEYFYLVRCFVGEGNAVCAGSVFRFEVGDETLVVDLSSEPGSIGPDSGGGADLTITARVETFMALLSGELSLRKAYLSRKLKLAANSAKPKLALAQVCQFSACLTPPSFDANAHCGTCIVLVLTFVLPWFLQEVGDSGILDMGKLQEFNTSMKTSLTPEPVRQRNMGVSADAHKIKYKRSLSTCCSRQRVRQGLHRPPQGCSCGPKPHLQAQSQQKVGAGVGVREPEPELEPGPLAEAQLQLGSEPESELQLQQSLSISETQVSAAVQAGDAARLPLGSNLGFPGSDYNTTPRFPPSMPSSSGTDAFNATLVTTRLEKHTRTLDQEGYSGIEDLIDADDVELAAVGLKTPEIRRLRKALAAATYQPENTTPILSSSRSSTAAATPAREPHYATPKLRLQAGDTPARSRGQLQFHDSRSARGDGVGVKTSPTAGARDYS
jgi:hypothetical protein